MRWAPSFSGLLGEELAEICKRFEFEGVAGGVEEEHGGLFADFALEAGVWLYDEGDACGFQSLRQGFPVGLGEDDAEVGDWNIVSINCVAVRVLLPGAGFVMSDDLVSEEIEVDPVFGAPALRQTENGAVEVASGLEIVDGKGDMEGSQSGHEEMLARPAVRSETLVP